MKKTILLLFAVLPFLSTAQPLFTLPLEKKNPHEQSLFVDNDGFSVAVLKYPSSVMLFFLKPGAGKLSEYEINVPGNDFEGFSSDENEFNVYYKTDFNKRKVITFYKDSRSPEMKDVSIPELQPKDKDYLRFTRNNKFYKIFKNDKLDRLSIYEFNGSIGKNTGEFTVPKNIFKNLEDRGFRYVPEQGNVSLDLLSGSKLYWHGDSIVFAYSDIKSLAYNKNSHVYVSLNFKKRTVLEQVISAGMKTTQFNDFLLGDKIFFVSLKRYSQTSVRYGDSLVLDILDAHSLKRIKRLEMSSETGISWQSTPFVSTLGDTLENKWKSEDRQRKMFRELYGRPFIQVTRNSIGYYIITLGTQIYYTSSGGGGAPSPVTGMVGGTMTTSAFGPQEYFKGCLSDTFDPATEFDVITPQDKVYPRKGALDKDMITKGIIRHRYGDFNVSCNSQHFYLMYIEKDPKTLIIEEF